MKPSRFRPVRHRAWMLCLAVALISWTPLSAHAQALPVGDPLEEYLRVLELIGRVLPGSVSVRPYPVWHGLASGDTVSHPWRSRFAGDTAATTRSGPHATLDPVRLRSFLNSSLPYGGNDGAVWAGKGLTTALDAGGTLAWGPLSVTLHPTLIYNQNGSFPLASVDRTGASMYGYPWRRIDLPQRFGPDSYTTLDPGQSTVRLTWRGVTTGFGTESLWWGPGIENAILMSDNAPGFPHAFLATSRPVDIGIGKVDAQWIWGRLQQSDWFDSTGTSPGRFLTGAVGSIRPKGLDGLTLGAARVYTLMMSDGGLGASEYFLIFQRGTKDSFATPDNPTGEDRRDQIFSLFARWAKPGSGFEVYAEWARNDHAWDLRDLILEPEHSQGYTLGFQQVVPLSGGRLLAVRSELTHLERSPTFQVRAEPTYYENWAVPPGYTQRGQIIGAVVGPGGDGQYLGADLYAPWGRAGLFVQRQVHDNDAYWPLAKRDDLAFCCHDVSLSGGARSLWFIGDVDLGVDAALTREFNRYFVANNDEWNLNLAVSARWRLRALR